MLNKDVKNTTIHALSLFDDEDLRKTLILHIPHSSIDIPTRHDYLISDEEIDKEIIKLTDIGTDVIFNLGPDVNKIKFPYNRIYCDVERLPDADEVMFQYGRGWFYSKTDDGRRLRNENNKDAVRVVYDSHHQVLNDKVKTTIENEGFATIVDCHSFSNTPFETDLIKEHNRPDICIGTDDFHTPKWLTDKLKSYFEDLGYLVKVNNPYAGTIVPLKYYKKEAKVLSIMIEVNRKLFVENNKVDIIQLLELNRVMRNMFTS